MPRQNRVDPFGRLVATPMRGTLMGNRGCLHDDAGNIVRHAKGQAWISCVTDWPGEKRPLAAPGQYTVLFFLDEATALAAGHRPCGYCRRSELAAFRAAWAIANDLAREPNVAAIDGMLAAQRGKLTPCFEPDGLPDGAMVTLAGSHKVWLRREGHWLPWSFQGYGLAEDLPHGSAMLITPEAIVATLRAGYPLIAAFVRTPS